MAQPDIVRPLRCDAVVDASRVALRLSGSVAVLTGIVHTYAERCYIEGVARRVRGVRSVRNLIEVRVTIGDYRTDETLLRIVREIIDALALMPPQRPEVSVDRGRVTISGTLRTPLQMRLIEEAIRPIAGIRDIENLLTVCE